MRWVDSTERVEVDIGKDALSVAGLCLEDCDVGPGRTALAAVASEPATMDAVFSTSARSGSVSNFLASHDSCTTFYA